MKNVQKKSKVLLVNLGGPTNAAEVEPFLLDLLTDPYMIDTPLPAWIQKKIFTFIAKRRAKSVSHKYKSMGFDGGSPLVSETKKQARALQTLLNKKKENTKTKYNTKWEVNVAMTCGEPNIRNLSASDLVASKENIIIPLYPQFSRSTTMSFARIAEKKAGTCLLSSAFSLPEFYDHPKYIQAICKLIMDFLNKKAKPEYFLNANQMPDKLSKNSTLLFSAHGIPMRHIKKGDTYQKSIEKNVLLFGNELRKKGFSGSIELSYQSRVGLGKWTTPSTIDMLKKLGASGCKSVYVYPISFVSDHLETLEEIEIELRDIACNSGIEQFIRIPAPGIWPVFIEFLAETVLTLQKSGQKQKNDCICLKYGGESSQIRIHESCC